jgi:hypothetical protein
MLSALFEAIVKSETPQLPLAISHSTDNDSAQRKMLRAAAIFRCFGRNYGSTGTTHFS